MAPLSPLPPLAHHRHHWRTVKSRSVMAVLGAVVAMVMALAVPTPAMGQSLEDERAAVTDELTDTQSQLDETTAKLGEIRDEITTVTARLDEAQTSLEVINAEIRTVEGEVADIVAEILDLNGAVAQARQQQVGRARALYMTGPVDSPALAMFNSTSIRDAVDRASTAQYLASQDQTAAERAQASATRFGELQDELEATQASLESMKTEAQQIRGAIEADLQRVSQLRDELSARASTLEGDISAHQREIDRIDAAIAERERREAEERRRRKEAEQRRQREAAERERQTRERDPEPEPEDPDRQPDPEPEPEPAPEPEPEPEPQPPGRVCPMSPASIVSFWGDPRGGGTRLHEGNDIMGEYRQPVVAIVSGTWDIQSRGNNAGLWAILRGDDGIDYWYLHLDGHAVGDGARVSKGQHVAYNGWTGNAVGTVYHIHFEVHPGGGGPVDPYPYIGPIC